MDGFTGSTAVLRAFPAKRRGNEVSRLKKYPYPPLSISFTSADQIVPCAKRISKLIIHHMKTFTQYPVIFLLLAAVSLGSCKKQDNIDPQAEYMTQVDDQMFISAEIDMVTMDANTIVESTDYFYQRTAETAYGVCDASFTVDSASAYKYFTVSYNGVNCAGRSRREGEVVITMKKGQSFADAGTVINISYKNLKVTRLADNKYIILNGDLDLTNQSGGRMAGIYAKSLVHIISSNGMNITFDNGAKRLWQLSVKRIFSLDNGLVITSYGNKNIGTQMGISAAGTTRTGRHFVTMIEEPMIIRQDCYFRLVSAKLIQAQGQLLTIKFGLDDKGQSVSCPNGAFYLQASYGAQSFLFPY